MILWELHWKEACKEQFLAFIEKLLLPLRRKTIGVIIDKAEIGSRHPWREVLAWLPEEIPAFIHLIGESFRDFPYELLDFVHIIGKSRFPYALPILDENLQFPPSKRLTKALLLPPKKSEGWDLVEKAIEERVIAEDRLIYDWDGIEELTIFPKYLSPQGARMVKGFQAAGGQIKAFPSVGASPQLLEI